MEDDNKALWLLATIPALFAAIIVVNIRGCQVSVKLGNIEAAEVVEKEEEASQ